MLNTPSFLIPVTPMGAPRQTQRDKWAKRPVVVRYHAFRDVVRLTCNLNQYVLGEEVHNAFEYMFVFSRGKPKSVNLIADKENVSFNRNPSKRTQRLKNGDLKDVPKAKKYKQYGVRWNYWLIYNQSRGEHLKHPAVFPEQLAADHIYSWSNEGDLVYDPFGGSGTTAKMAHQLKRNWVLSEISSEYCEIAQKRIAAHTAQMKMF